MIILGILIYSFINNKNNKEGFSISSIGWAILKNSEDVVPNPDDYEPDIGSQNQDDYNFYYNFVYDRDDIISTFPTARRIYIFDINEELNQTTPISYTTNTSDPINFGTIEFQYYAGLRYTRPETWERIAQDAIAERTNCAVGVKSLMTTSIEIWSTILLTRQQAGHQTARIDFNDNKLPFQRAITYTLQNNNVPLFYTASRFYYSIIHLFRNGDINNLIINQPLVTNIGNAMGWFGGNSSIGSGIMSVSTCLCDYTYGESATDYYFNRYSLTSPNERNTKEEIINYMFTGYQGGDPPIDGRDLAEEDRARFEDLSRDELLSRVIIIFKPRDTSNIDELLEQTTRTTWAYGRWPRKSRSQKIILLNQDLLNPKGEESYFGGSTQARLLYTYEGWEAVVFLSDRQRGIIDSFNIRNPNPRSIPALPEQITVPSNNRHINKNDIIKIKHYNRDNIYYDARVYRINPPDDPRMVPSEFTVSYTPTSEVGPLDSYKDRVPLSAVLNVNVDRPNGYLVRWKFNDDP